jgi:hypothetical protein
MADAKVQDKKGEGDELDFLADPSESTTGKRKRRIINPIKMYQEHRTKLRLERER